MGGWASRCLVETPVIGTSLVVLWLRLHTPNAGSPGTILQSGSELDSACQNLKKKKKNKEKRKKDTLRAATKTWHSPINKYTLKKKKRNACDRGMLLHAFSPHSELPLFGV